MGRIFGIIFLGLFLLFAFLIMRRLFLKSKLHFQLLKKIFSEELNDVNSNFTFMGLPFCYGLDFSVLIWYWMPFYYTKISMDELVGDALEVHLKLKRNNRRFGITMLCFIIFFIASWIMFVKLGN